MAANCNVLLILLIFITILETLLFAFIQGGWSSYIYILLDNGFYSDLCVKSQSDILHNDSWISSIDEVNVYDNASSSLLTNTNSIYFINQTQLVDTENKGTNLSNSKISKSKLSELSSCKEQQERLHLLYTIAIALLEILTVGWGPMIYKFGVIGPKVVSMILFITGSMMLGFANPNIPLLIVPGITLVGVGGLGIVVINLKVSSILPFGAGLYVAVLSGACDSSVITFRIVKLLHEAGVPDLYPFIGIIVLHIIISGVSLGLHKLFNRPEEEVISDPPANGAVHLMKDDVNDDVFEMETFKNSEKRKEANNIQHDKRLLDGKHTSGTVADKTVKDSICSTLTFSLIFWLAILMLNFFLYLGSINTRLQNNFPDKVSHFTNILAYAMFGGILTGIIPGSIAEWQIKAFKDRVKSKERRLLPNVLPMTIGSGLAITLNILAFFPSEPVLYAEFAVFTMFRSFLFSTNMAFIVSVYPQKHTNIILPLGLTVGGLVSTVQIPIFSWFNQSEESKLQVKIFMTFLVALTLIHPVITVLKAKGFLTKLKTNEEITEEPWDTSQTTDLYNSRNA